VLVGLVLAGPGCGPEASSETGPAATAGTPDAGQPSGEDGGRGSAWTCGTPAPAGDLCAAVPTGTLTGCGEGANGEQPQTGYLDIAMPDGSHIYSCATSWSDGGDGGYFFSAPDSFMSDPQSCCGGEPTPVATPMLPPIALGTLGAPHGPRDIKPQESMEPGSGPIRSNPFAVVVRDQGGADAYAAALANWQAWSGDGAPHGGADGQGAYYFSAELLVNYVILESSDGAPVLVVSPEVSLTDDGMTPLGHPTLGACATGGGAPLVLMAGEVWGTTITNHSGRFNHDPAVTQEALDNAAKLFNCFGIGIDRTTYYTPKPVMASGALP
jgi:hypothetical protein